MRFLPALCLLCFAFPAFAFFQGNPTDPAVGDGYVTITPREGGIVLPEPVAQTYRVAPASRAGELKGPVHGVRTSTVKRHHHVHLESIEEYDRQGRLIHEEQYDDKSVLSGKKLIVFSPRGNRRETVFNGQSITVTGYDPAGRELFLKEYSRNGRGALEFDHLVTHSYDIHGREIAWREVTRKNGHWQQQGAFSQQLDADGRITHLTKWPTSENPGSGRPSVETFNYDTRKRITCYSATIGTGLLITASWRYGPAGLVEHRVRHCYRGRTLLVIYHYDPTGRLLTREEHATSYNMIGADGKTSWVEVDEHVTDGQGTPPADPPLTLRTIYSYDDKGRLTRVAHFDGKNAPCYQQQEIEKVANDKQLRLMTMVYSYLDYQYDGKGKPHFAAFTADGKTVLGCYCGLITIASESLPSIPYGFPTSCRVIYINRSHQITDRHGNWIRDNSSGVLQVRKISYYR